MLGDINIKSKKYIDKFEMILCKPSGEELCVLQEAYNRKLNIGLYDTYELDFTIPFYIEQQEKQIKNSNWDFVRIDYLIKVNNEVMFIINNVSEDDSDGIDLKNVHAYSLEYTLGRRYLRGLRGTRQLYKSTLDGVPSVLKYSIDNSAWNTYSQPIVIPKNKIINVKILNSKNQEIVKYIVQPNDPTNTYNGLRVTSERYDSDNIKVTIKTIEETGDGILNLLEKETTWRIGYIDEDVRDDKSLGQDHRKYRTFDLSEKSWLEVLKEDIPKTFECVLKYDTINKIINIYHIDNIGKNRGLYICNENYLKSIKRNIKADEVITRMSIYGKDNLSIASVNPTGYLYIENFDYYKNKDYMPQDLITALDNYENLVRTKTPTFKTLLKDLDTLYVQDMNLKNQLAEIQLEYNKKQDAIDVIIQTWERNKDKPNVETGGKLEVNLSDLDRKDLSELNSVRDAVKSQINIKQNEIQNNENSIESKENQINSLKKELKKENNFNSAQLKLLDTLTFEKTWSNANYSNAEELIEAGYKALEKLAKPIVEFETGIEDFLNVIECQHDWTKLNLGDLINLHHENFGIDTEVRLVSIQYDIDSNGLSIVFTNKDDADNNKSFLTDMARSISDTNNTVTIGKGDWDSSKGNTDLVSRIISSSLDSAKNRILSARNQNIELSERGLSMKDMDDDQEQLRIVNNCIAMTTDAWKHCSLAITPRGIIAEEIYGKIVGSNKLIITNMNEKGESSFLVDGDHMKAINMDLSLENKSGKNRIYLNPDVGIKIQKGQPWDDVLWLDNEGEVHAKGFHVINTHTLLDDTGLTIDNGKITINNADGQNVFYVDNEGNLTLDGRLRVMSNDGTKVMLDAYKDEAGGKLLINDINEARCIDIGTKPLDSNYDGGSLILYNKDVSKKRVQLCINKDDDAGTINLLNSDGNKAVHLSARDKENNHGVISLSDKDGTERIVIHAVHDKPTNNGIAGSVLEFKDSDGKQTYGVGMTTNKQLYLYDDFNSRMGIEHIRDGYTALTLRHHTHRSIIVDDTQVIMRFNADDSSSTDQNNSYVKATDGELLLQVDNNNYIKITRNGVEVKGKVINLN